MKRNIRQRYKKPGDGLSYKERLEREKKRDTKVAVANTTNRDVGNTVMNTHIRKKTGFHRWNNSKFFNKMPCNSKDSSSQ